MSFYAAILAATMSSGSVWGMVNFLLARRMRLVEGNLQAKVHRAEAELVHVKCQHHDLKVELAQAQDQQKRLRLQCPATYEEPFEVHRCLQMGGHTGVHHDVTVAWYGTVQFPLPDLLPQELAEVVA